MYPRTTSPAGVLRAVSIRFVNKGFIQRGNVSPASRINSEEKELWL